LEAIYEIYKNLTLKLQLLVVIETAYKIGNLDKFEIEEKNLWANKHPIEEF
jgi:hypothetical protein